MRSGGSNSTENIYSNTAVNDNQWHFVGFTWNEAEEKIIFYVDGNEVHTENKAISIVLGNLSIIRFQTFAP